MNEDLFFIGERDVQSVGTVRNTLNEDGVFDITNANASIFLCATVSHTRIKIFFFTCLLVFCLFAARAFYLQIVTGKQYQSLAEGNRLRLVRIPAARGILYDQKGVPLVENTPSFVVTLTAADLPTNEEQLTYVSSTLARYGVSGDEWESALSVSKATPFEAVPVTNRLSYEQAIALSVDSANVPGVVVQVSTDRSYLSGSHAPDSLAHVLGYMGRISPEQYIALKNSGYGRNDSIGKTGLESTLENALRGTQGLKQVEVNAMGREQRIVSAEMPTDGTNFRLTIDLAAQKKLEELMQAELKVTGKKRASGIVLDPRDGRVIALVSLPAYDPNIFVGGISTDQYKQLSTDPNLPLFPRAIAGTYPSGSTFKMVVATAALTEGVITPQTTVLSTGGIWYKKVWFFPDWKAGGHGVTNVIKAIAESVNTFFYTIGGGTDTFTGLGPDRIAQYASRFGFGKQTGIPLSGEAKGLVPTPAWKQASDRGAWFIGDTYHFAIGQGDFLATPLQIANMTAAVANGGSLWQPRLVQSLLNAETGVWQDATSTMLADNRDLAKALAVVREGMRATITVGSARSLQSVPVPVAGKTGTAQYGDGSTSHAWFTGYAPADAPIVEITTMIEDGGEGSTYAAPIARDFLTWYFTKKDEASGTPKETATSTP